MSYHDVSPSNDDQQSPWEEEADYGPEASMTSGDELHIRSDSPSIAEANAGSTTLIPVWLREQGKSFHFRWVPLPIRRTARFLDDWTRGPEEAEIQKIRPWIPLVQEAPIWLVKRFLPLVWHRALALSLLLGAWLLTFCLILKAQQSSGQIEGYGHPVSLWCGANYWADRNGCGLDGNNCRPFDNSTLPFKCNANCRSVKQLTPHAVGTHEIQYTEQVIGGADRHGEHEYYRADSFICQAAIHAGVVSDETGGCGVVELSGPRESFHGSEGNKISSIGFDGAFPKSFHFRKDISSDCGTVDMRWKLLGVTVTFTTIISLFVWEPWLFFTCIFPMLFFHVGMVSDKPNISDIPSLFSVIIGRFLPAALSVTVLYLAAVRPQLTGLTAQVEKTVLWLGAAWVGALNNYTFDWIPVSRLTPHDLKQPGAVLSVVLIVLVIFFIALGQIWYLRLEKRLRTYLAIYLTMGAGLIICVIIPQLNLRIHHYVLALLLTPGTRTQTRPALFYQGLLVGLFINGLARWGFDSILQTSAELFHGGDVQSLLPNITDPIVLMQNITFNWHIPPEGYDGVSVLVNDVERRRWYIGEGSPSMLWERKWDEDAEIGEKFYFRFGYMQGSDAADYSRAGTWEKNGTWTTMEPGTSTNGKKR